MSRLKRIRLFANWSLSVFCLLFSSACSLVLDYNECSKDADCSGDNLICKKGYCVQQDAPDSLESELLTSDCTRVYGVGLDDPEAFHTDTILIGSLLPLSGDLSAKGPKMAQGIQLAVDEINEAGGLLGKKVAVLLCDSGTNSENAKRALKHMVNIKRIRIPAVIGPASSSVVISSFTDVAKGAQLLMMSPAATSPQITALADNNLLWRTVASDAIQGAAIAQYLLSDETYKSVAIVHRNDAYGNGLRDAISDILCSSETFTCDKDSFYTRNYNESTQETDQSEIVAAMGAFEPNIIVVIGFSEDGGEFIKLAANGGFDRFILSEGLNSNGLKDLELDDELLCQLSGTQPVSRGDNYNAFQSRFEGNYGDVGTYTGNAYDAMYLIGYAIAATNSSTPTGPEVAKGLMRLSSGDKVNAGASPWNNTTKLLSSNATVTIDYDGVSGALDFDENGEAPADIEGWAFDVDEGETYSLGTVYKADGTYEDVFRDTPGRGAACGSVSPGKPCENSGDCDEGDYCDKSKADPICARPPTGQGTACSASDTTVCAEFEADFCETTVSNTCLKQGCNPDINDCSDDRICCNFAWAGLPSLCVDKAASGGVCTTGMCETDDACPEGTVCDFRTGGGICTLPPLGEGEPCESQLDCLHLGATYCDLAYTNTCLSDSCTMALDNCSEGHRCCDLSWLEGDPIVCIPDSAAHGNCPCITNDTCREDEYCDRSIGAAAGDVGGECVKDPTGQGEPCESDADCAGYEADFCDVNGSSTCLKQGCDSTYGNCSIGYRCCASPNVCMAIDRYATDC